MPSCHSLSSKQLECLQYCYTMRCSVSARGSKKDRLGASAAHVGRIRSTRAVPRVF